MWQYRSVFGKFDRKLTGKSVTLDGQ
jgi:hypothetical protein